MSGWTSEAGSANMTSRSTPPARMRPTPLAFARRNHGLFAPYADRTYSSSVHADDPHRHIRPERAVRAFGGELQLLGLADASELLVRPCGHRRAARVRHRRRSSLTHQPNGFLDASRPGIAVAGEHEVRRQILDPRQRLDRLCGV